MWSDNLDGNKFLKTLYDSDPELLDVRISKIHISEEGEKVTIAFDLPYFADNVPKKWLNLGYNTVVAEIDFFGIKELSMHSSGKSYQGNIQITKNKIGEVILNIEGSVSVTAKAELGNISSIRGYCNSP